MERLREIGQKILGKLGQLPFKSIMKYSGLIFGIALLTLWFSFPLGAALEVAKRKAGTGIADIEFTDASLGLLGPNIQGLIVKQRGSTRKIYFDEFSARPGLSTLWLSPSVAMSGVVGDQDLSGSFGLNDPHQIQLEFDAVDLLQFGLGAALPLGVKLSGNLSGGGKFTWSKVPEDVTGEVSLAVNGARLFGATLPLPSTSVTIEAIKVKLIADGGLIKIEPITIDGKEIWGNIRGTVKLDKTIQRSKTDIRIRLQFSDEIEGAIGAILPVAGFRKEKDAYIKQFRGPLYKILGG